jgi:hypothetical protein
MLFSAIFSSSFFITLSWTPPPPPPEVPLNMLPLEKSEEILNYKIIMKENDDSIKSLEKCADLFKTSVGDIEERLKT